MQTIAIVQARSNSKRLKNKMFAKLGKHKVLEWVLYRLRKIKKINKFILATSNNNEKGLIKLAKKYRYEIFKGSENNVLSRYYSCAKNYKSKTIIRVCADNPFIDSETVSDLITFFKKKKIDYACNTMQIKNNLNSDGFGAEIFTFQALSKAYNLATSKTDKEHVTKIMRDRKNLFKSEILPSKNGINFPYLRFDVNTPRDLNKLRSIIYKQKLNINSSAKSIIKSLIVKNIDNNLREMFKLNRSITGTGNKKTLEKVRKIIPIKIKKIPSGTKVYDWKIPKVWDVKEAWIKDNQDNKILDYKDNNLSLINYSSKFNGYIPSKKLIKKIYFHPHLINAIPYKTSYYKKDWGFCVTRKIFKKIKSSKSKFKVKIDSTFKKGNLIYGELIIKGKSNKEILISTYICHPSMANDNLSGIILTSYLAKFIRNLKNRYWTYRIIFVPETIGAIGYSYLNESKMKNIDFGLVICNVGGKGSFGYKKSFDDKHFLNDLVQDTFRELKVKPKVYPFDINGSDERQYSSQHFGINICSIFKDKYYEFKEYHSSKDNLDLVKAENIFETLKIYQKLIEKIEVQNIFKSKNPKCEAMLSKYNLYPKLGGEILPKKKSYSKLDIILWLMFLSNGKRTVDQISDQLKIKKKEILNIYKILKKKNLIYRV